MDFPLEKQVKSNDI